MVCTLCNHTIAVYNPQFNQLRLDENHTVELCGTCLDKIVKWQQQQFAKLFPSTQAKKWAKLN